MWNLLTAAAANPHGQPISGLPGELAGRAGLDELKTAHDTARELWTSGAVDGSSAARAVVVLSAAIRLRQVSRP